MGKNIRIKGIVVIIVGSLFLFATHKFAITQFLELGATQSILDQHLFFMGIVGMVFLSTAITHHFSPKNTGFVFLGLLLAKMIIASLFIYKMGWFDAEEFWVDKAVFLGFYFLYTILLIVLIIPFLKRI
ncbi:hypothetical protein ACJRPK_01810 [Aquimarina sp. 2-A2]|uniref:hypothetical protein n=1 Tax=Aquimarina sp. 2-A2 TaxID=3382644 RepID=UPI00387EF9C8